MGIKSKSDSIAGNRVVSIHTQDRKPILFRFGQFIYASNLEYLSYRDPLGSFLTYGVYEKSFKTMSFVKTGTDKEIPLSDTLSKFFERNMDEILHNARYRSITAETLLVIKQKDIDSEMTLEIDNVYLRSIPKSNIIDKKVDKHGDLSYVEFDEVFEDEVEDIGLNQINYKSTDNVNIKDVIHIKAYRGKNIGSSQPWIEPIIDELIGMSLLRENAVIFGIRAGTGIKVVKVDEDIFNNDEEMAKMHQQHARIGARDSIVYVPTSGREDAGESDFDILSIDQIRFQELANLLMEAISAYTGIPKNVLFGEEGSRVGAAEANIEHNYEAISRIQEDYSKNVFMPVIKRLDEVLELGVDVNDIDIVFDKKEAPSEKEQAEIDIQAMDAMDKKLSIYNRLISMGATHEDAMDITGIAIRLDQISNIGQGSTVVGGPDVEGGPEEPDEDEGGGPNDGDGTEDQEDEDEE